MDFPTPLLRGTLVKRYKRFMADVLLEDGTPVTAHCPNSGSMLSVNPPGAEVWVSPASNPERKLKYTWELVRIGDHLVGVNTNHPNAIVAEAIAQGRVPGLTGYETLRREVKYGRNSRIDVLLAAPDRPSCYVEVKNVTLRRDPGTGRDARGLAEFPDAVTSRGAKHLEELTDMVAAGHRAMMVYLVQRGDCDRFRIAADLDPAYEEALSRARASGVDAVCMACDVTPARVTVSHALPMDLDSPV
ncbi:DNA/RNA nuclease SfsA [Roseospira visakhapatnamensis]|uniref:Sugar fermentation stimulation protein homolog n=1 Tax=Roseospira visakhapatnamensis TaxID=390880 RepID=A0A7W6RCK4_9PROT|nr:DNA/RNA nuclease SfsA [Roseospira visakhapatnamensis]MBB4265927.1 sugar fermentation stimulation protein A [Roseospira visakhapatnamensis]